MKILCSSRGTGKTTKLIYASEFQDAHIICSDNGRKEHILNMAKTLNLEIPEPIVASELVSGTKWRHLNKSVLVDDADAVLSSLLSQLWVRGPICGISISSDNNSCNRRKDI